MRRLPRCNTNHPRIPSSPNITLHWIAGMILFILPCSVAARDNSIPYKVVHSVTVKTASRSFLKLRIYLPHDPSTKESFIRLRDALRKKYNNSISIEADVFSSKEGAKNFSEIKEFLGYDLDYPTWRARYSLDLQKKQEYLEYSEGPNEIGKPMIRIDFGHEGRAGNLGTESWTHWTFSYEKI